MVDPYKTPAAEIEVDQSVTPDQDFIDFSGGEDYPVKWAGLRNATSELAGFNWSNFLVGYLWCCYRKMYLFAAALFFLGVAVSALSTYVFLVLAPENNEYLVRVVAFTATALFVRVPSGFIANKLYFKKAIKAIADAPNEDPDTRSAYLRNRGGTNGIIVWLLMGMNLALYLAAIFAAPGFGEN